MSSDTGIQEYPIKKHIRYNYDECFAKFVLEALFPDRYKDLLIQDRPDLQSADGLFGIEVTNAMPTEYLRKMHVLGASHVFSRFKIESYKNKIYRYNYTLNGIDSVTCYRVNRKTLSIKHPARNIINAFQTKVNKLNSINSNYAVFENTELFIIHDNPGFENDFNLICKAIDNINNQERKYTRLYVSAAEGVYVFDFNNAGRIQNIYMRFHSESKDYGMKAMEYIREKERESCDAG